MLHEVSFASFNGRDQVQGWIYVPACKPKGIVQVIHGFGEHSRRYLHMISAFLDAGYIVAADDHVGHGKTAMVNEVWGDWGDKGPHTMMEDEHTLKGIVCEKYPDLPYFLFGHSMGSFITRDFIAKYGDELTGATICGTTGIFRGAKEVGEKLKEVIDAGHGEESNPEFAGELMGWMCERCGEVSIGNEWICADPYVQRDHAEDPFDAFTRPTSNRSIYDFIAKYGDELTGATICGTTGIFRGAKEVGEKLKEVIDAGHGEESNPEFAGELMGWMCERCGEVSIGNEWICADPYVQRDHAEDPFDAFTRPTSNRSIYDFIQMMEQIEGTKWAEKVPIDLPIYNIAGDQDPVSEYGVGVYQVSNWLIQTGHTVTTKLYSGYRHEIHNYAEIKNEVEAGIIAFMDGILS